MLLVGQEDFKHGGRVIGINEEEFQKEFVNAITSIRPKPLTQQKIVEAKGVKLALVRVQEVGSLKPCSYKGVFYERIGDSVHQLPPEEVKRYHLLYGAPNAEDMPTHAKKRREKMS